MPAASTRDLLKTFDQPNELVDEILPKDALRLNGRYETPLLNEREATHGNFDDTARIATTLKRHIHAETYARGKRGQAPLTPRQVESLDLIATKIARIISGDASNPDHWNDIAGYAKLVSEA